MIKLLKAVLDPVTNFRHFVPEKAKIKSFYTVIRTNAESFRPVWGSNLTLSAKLISQVVRDAGYLFKISVQLNQRLIEITKHHSSRQITVHHLAWLLEGFRLASETKSKPRLLFESSTLIIKA